MELSWTTFVLEIINFLVLLWILKRFLYKPVLEVINKRQAKVEETLQKAKELSANADSLQKRYETRLIDWEKERLQARHSLAQELQIERRKGLNKLMQELQQEREKAKASKEQRRADERNEMEKKALTHAAQFASLLLKKGSTETTQKHLFDLAIKQLKELPKEKLASLKARYFRTTEAVSINTGFSLDEEQQEELIDVLKKILPFTPSFEFKVNPDLIAGIRIAIGGWVIGLNLRDELEGFIQLEGWSHERA